jgi:hypothetical protein
MPMDKITDLIKKQINDMPKWIVTSISLDGYDARRYTYSGGGSQLYVMIPNEESIEEAKQKINDVLEGTILESSYTENTTGQINIPKTIAVAEPPVVEQVQEEKPQETPEEPAEPIIIEDPVQPEEPDTPENPEEPEQPEQPEEPSIPENPEEPEKPQEIEETEENNESE